VIGSESYDSCVSSGLRACGVDKLFLEIHDTSFPAFFKEDTMRGTPYAGGAATFLEQLVKLGFNGIQLGPQGLTAADNPSPYDGTIFSRNPLNVALSPLVQEGLLDASDLDSLLAGWICWTRGPIRATTTEQKSTPNITACASIIPMAGSCPWVYRSDIEDPFFAVCARS